MNDLDCVFFIRKAHFTARRNGLLEVSGYRIKLIENSNVLMAIKHKAAKHYLIHTSGAPAY